MIAAALLCLSAAGVPTVRQPLADGRFTLRWTHSIEKILWEEDYRVAGGWLFLEEARVRGTGAGMEIPEGARLEHGVYRYRTADPWLRELRLARSRYTLDYSLCIDERCLSMSHWIDIEAGVTVLRDCRHAPYAP